jgi:hypothetical protein
VKTLIGLIAVVVMALAGFGFAQDNQPASAPATAPAATPPAGAAATPADPTVDPAAKKILDDLETAGQKHQTIQGDLDYTVSAVATAETEIRKGTVKYQKGADDKTSASFRIHFDTLKQNDGPAVAQPKDYAFNPQEGYLYITEPTQRLLRRIQIAAPGEKIEPMRIGEGPFPLPFGQKTADVLKYCTATTRAPAAGDPKDTVYLRLVPRPESKKDMNFAELQMWIDPKLNLPVKIASRERNRNVTTVVFSDIVLNKPLPADIFKIERPTGWKLEVTPLEEKAK